MTDMNVYDMMKLKAAAQGQQTQNIQDSGNSFANWAMQRPGTVSAMANGGAYNGWNAIADVIGAYWQNWKNNHGKNSEHGEVPDSGNPQQAPILNKSGQFFPMNGGNNVSAVVRNLSKAGIDPAKEMPNILRMNPNLLGTQDAQQPILNTSGQFFPNTDGSFADWAKR